MNYKDFLKKQLELSTEAAKSDMPEYDKVSLYQYINDLKKRITVKESDETEDFIIGEWYYLPESILWGREGEFYQFIGMCQETDCNIKKGEIYIFRGAGESTDYGDKCSYYCYSQERSNDVIFLKALVLFSIYPNFENAQVGDSCFSSIGGNAKIVEITKGNNQFIITVEVEHKDGRDVSKICVDYKGFHSLCKNHPILFNSEYQFRAYWAEQFKTEDEAGIF